MVQSHSTHCILIVMTFRVETMVGFEQNDPPIGGTTTLRRDNYNVNFKILNIIRHVNTPSILIKLDFRVLDYPSLRSV